MERKGISGVTVGIVFAFAFNTGIFLGKLTDNGDERVREVQIQNEQLQEQLSTEYGQVGNLVLNDETDTFEYRKSNGDKCEGEYRVENDTAVAVGNIACTQTMPIGDK